MSQDPAAKTSTKQPIWATVLVFVAGFAFAFVATAVFIDLGPSPIWVWALFVTSSLVLWQLPALKNPSEKWTTVLAYSLPFLTLWAASNPSPRYNFKSFILYLLLGLLALVSILTVARFFSLVMKSPALRNAAGALFGFFVCAWLVAFFSSSTGAGNHMIGMLMRLGFGKSLAETAALVIRKTLHFAFYGILAIFAFRAMSRGGNRNTAALLALFLALCHASFDEIRQSSYLDRTGSFWDVCLDMCGAAAFVGLAQFRAKPTRKAATERTQVTPTP